MNFLITSYIRYVILEGFLRCIDVTLENVLHFLISASVVKKIPIKSAMKL